MAGMPAHQEFPCHGSKHASTTCQYVNSSTPLWVPCKYAKTSAYAKLAGHSDVCELGSNTISKWVRSNSTIFKQHIAPTLNNLQLVLNAVTASPPMHVLLLTRSVEGSVHAVCE